MKIRKIFTFLGLALFSVIALASCKDKDKDNEGSSAGFTYVAPDASPDGAGTEESPLSFAVAASLAKPGETLLLAGGTYKYNARMTIENNGMPNKYITVKPQGEEPVIFDFSEMFFDSSNRGIQLNADFWHFKNIEVTGAGDNGMYVSGSYNIIEDCLFYNNRDSGLQLGRGKSADVSIEDWPSYNLIKNCTSFANYDAETYGENADGFACKLTSGYGNVFDGCIAYRNSDDGWDLYAKEDSGNIGIVMLYNCVSFENGYLPYQIDRVNDEDNSTYKSYNTMNGDGIGFKLGGGTMEGDVILDNCVAFNNKLHGFSDNSNPGVINIKNSTAFNNCISLTDDGKVSGRGTDGGKSNNFDLARGSSGVSNCYNNYYGLLSYVNNQGSFIADEGEEDDVELTYNSDKFRGSAAYSIFNTGYNEIDKKENYVKFTAYEDASTYASLTNDITFSSGTEFTGLSDSSFASLQSLNVLCSSVAEITSLKSYHTSLRNEDMSVNLGDLLKVTDSTLLSFANGKQIGANLAKSSYDEYPHYVGYDLTKCTTADEVRMESAYSVTEVLCDANAVFQDFEVPKLIDKCDISWESSHPEIAEIEVQEKVSVSDAIFSKVKIYVPAKDTEVTLKATLKCGELTRTKEFKILVKSRAQSMGGITIDGDTSMRVEKFATAAEPRVYALDDSAIGTRELPASLYNLSYEYNYASSKADSFYPVDGVYSSVPGVYEVTVTATSKIASDKDQYGNPFTETLKYYIYILDKDCTIDFMIDEATGAPMSTITLTSEGFNVSGYLSNLYGDMYAVYSAEELTLTAEELIAREDAEVVEIDYDAITLDFSAGELTGKEFYAYYVVSNKNKTALSQVYSFSTNVVEVATEADFNTLATTGKLGGDASSTTIYKLTKDLDYAETTWTLATKSDTNTFSGMFNGDGHTIKNISVEKASADTNVALFYKVQNGSIINTTFENISLLNKDSANGKCVGIIARLQGGYLHNIAMKNVTVKGSERIGALVGQCIGGYNYITQCSLVNDTDHTITVAKKYAAGLIGEAEVESSITDKTLYIEFKDCYVNANIGDGEDSGGCQAGMLGRVKDTYATTTIKFYNCYYTGVITSYGNYCGGMLGDVSVGNGTFYIFGCYSDVAFMYRGTKLDIDYITSTEDQQKYAHKNQNPMVGRAAQVAKVGQYYSKDNIGTWSEYYSAQVLSSSLIFDLARYDEDNMQFEYWELSAQYLTRVGYDLENVWSFEGGNLALR